MLSKTSRSNCEGLSILSYAEHVCNDKGSMFLQFNYFIFYFKMMMDEKKDIKIVHAFTVCEYSPFIAQRIERKDQC